MGFGQSLKSPVAATLRTKHLMLQSLASAIRYRPGGKGSLKLGVFLGRGQGLGPTTITLKGPPGLEAERKSLSGLDKARTVLEVPFEFAKDAEPGAYDLEVTVTYTTQSKGKDPETFSVRYTLPVVLE